MAENTTQESGTPTSTGFSREYVEQLRSENADWRRKFQTERERNQVQEIGLELTRRGVTAEAGWVERPEGMTATQAVDAFIAKYPHLKPAQTDNVQATETQDVSRSIGTGAQNEGTGTAMPKPMGAGQSAGSQTPRVSSSPEAIRSLQEVKNDPKARAQVSANYREMLRNQGNVVPPDTK